MSANLITVKPGHTYRMRIVGETFTVRARFEARRETAGGTEYIFSYDREGAVFGVYAEHVSSIFETNTIKGATP